ncbi:MAG: hypothetical protein J6S91_05810, partial [Treponema sp.]|nr:hypothetical protein [Treponema sp.]
RVISGTIASAFGTLTNTVCVMGAIYIFYANDLILGMTETLSKMGFAVESLSGIKGYLVILGATLLTNGLWEIVGAVILTAAILGSIYLVENKKSKLSKIEE